MSLEPVDISLTLYMPAPLKRLLMSLALAYHRLRYGYSIRLIPVGQGRYAIVDADDYHRLAKYKWRLCTNGHTFYAYRYSSTRAGKKRQRVWMHNQIIAIPEGLVCDHINHNGLNNRKANVRPATASQNNCNTRRKVKTTSRYRGVTRDARSNRYRARIEFNGRNIHLGTFDDKVDAAKAYDEAAKKYHGEFAILNFPDRTPTWIIVWLCSFVAKMGEKCVQAFNGCQNLLKSARNCAKTTPDAGREIDVSICRVSQKIGQNTVKVRETCENLIEVLRKCAIMNTVQMPRGP
jgi:hypothetical protein